MLLTPKAEVFICNIKYFVLVFLQVISDKVVFIK